VTHQKGKIPRTDCSFGRRGWGDILRLGVTSRRRLARRRRLSISYVAANSSIAILPRFSALLHVSHTNRPALPSFLLPLNVSKLSRTRRFKITCCKAPTESHSSSQSLLFAPPTWSFSLARVPVTPTSGSGKAILGPTTRSCNL
jgi:hypothetical protein